MQKKIPVQRKYYLLDRIIICNRKALGTKWEEVSDDWTMYLMPISLWDATLIGDNLEELTPERKAWDCRHMSKFGNVEWKNVTKVKNI